MLQIDPFDVAVAFGCSHPGIQAVALSTSRAERVGSLVAAVQKRFPAEVWQTFQQRQLIDPSYPYLA
jgi:aryl-alcohol dehydrogenase-like predicted oxidoreductase